MQSDLPAGGIRSTWQIVIVSEARPQSNIVSLDFFA